MGLTIFDVMGRTLYARFMALSIVSVAALGAAVALTHLRWRALGDDKSTEDVGYIRTRTSIFRIFSRRPLMRVRTHAAEHRGGAHELRARDRLTEKDGRDDHRDERDRVRVDRRSGGTSLLDGRVPDEDTRSSARRGPGKTGSARRSRLTSRQSRPPKNVGAASNAYGTVPIAIVMPGDEERRVAGHQPAAANRVSRPAGDAPSTIRSPPIVAPPIDAP